jgi:peptidoglycan LD-endopeptidase LytH
MSDLPFDFAKFEFHPVIALPKEYEIFDFSKGYDPNRKHMAYGIGRYDEKRAGMYTTELFSPNDANARNIHVGIDIAAPVGEPIHAFYEGEIFLFGVNAADGDYGGTLITRHRLGGKELYALFGHLAHKSLSGKQVGQKIERGEVIAWVGDKSENGGWNPHLHFQLSWKKPVVCDMPGAVSDADREEALKIYPDPRNVLGRLY